MTHRRKKRYSRDAGEGQFKCIGNTGSDVSLKRGIFHYYH